MNDDERREAGRKLREWRGPQTREWVAAYLGVSARTVYSIERADPGVAAGTVRRVMAKVGHTYTGAGEPYGRLHNA